MPPKEKQALKTRVAGKYFDKQAVSRAYGNLMTVLTMILGMLPLAVGSGAGAVGNRSLALAVIGGMTIGTIALLFVTPAFYMVFQKLHEKLTPEKDDE